MKKKACILSILLLATLFGTAGAKEINVLFMGNSFTFRHDLPELVKIIFEEGQTNLTVNVEQIVYGGQDLFRHYNLFFSQSMVRLNSIKVPEIEDFMIRIDAYLDMQEAPNFYTAYCEQIGLAPEPWSKITSNLEAARHMQRQLIERIRNNKRVKWDYLVLQSWRDVVADGGAGYAAYVEQWAKIAEKEGIKLILYITAPHAHNPTPVDAPRNAEQTAMEMQTIRELTKRVKPHAVVPVALGIQAIQEGGTDLTFCYVNDWHPNQYCAFLTANMFYAAFFNESTEGFAFNTVVENKDKGAGEGKDPDGGDAKVVLDDETKELLQRVAYESVVQFNSAVK